MRDSRLQIGKLFPILIAGLLLVSSQIVMAQGNSNGNSNAGGNGNGNGKNKNVGIEKTSDEVNDSVTTSDEVSDSVTTSDEVNDSVTTKGNSNGNAIARANGKNRNIGVGNASDGVKGRIITNQRIYYTGDPLEISLRFARGSGLIVDGTVDAFVVIFVPTENESEEPDTVTDTDTDPDVNALTKAIVLPVSNVASADAVKLFELGAVDIGPGTLSAGTYQLGLILTKPGGDPLIINDWYRGVLGLEDIVGITITGEIVDFDVDGDREVDDDSDGDGFSDDPDTDDPDTDAPDTDAPDTDVPDTDVPDTDAPDTSNT